MRMDQKYEHISKKLKVIAHPERIKILEFLMKKGPQNVTQLCTKLDLPQSTVSQHLSKFNLYRITYRNRKGIACYYSIANKNSMKKILCLLQLLDEEDNL